MTQPVVVSEEGTFGRRFWRKTIERAVKTAAQAIVGVLSGDIIFDVFQIGDWKIPVGAAITGFVLSVVTSIASAPFGPTDTPSLV